MEDHIRELLNRYQYSEEVKEVTAFRMLFGGEDALANHTRIRHTLYPNDPSLGFVLSTKD